MSFIWGRPSKKEVATTATFIDAKGTQIHDGLGGPSRLDPTRAQYVQPRPYLKLQEVLKKHLPVPVTPNSQPSQKSWDDLYDKISTEEAQFIGTGQSSLRLFWYKLGERKEGINAWFGLIPDEYGLSVVKAAVALTLQLAQDSLQKRQKIFTTFEELRDALVRADPKKTSFRTDKTVSDCTDRLYYAVVDGIEDLILFLSPGTPKKSNIIPRYKSKPSQDAFDAVLEKVQASTKAFERAVAAARDQAIESTAKVTTHLNSQANLIRHDVKVTEINVRQVLTKGDETLEKLEGVGDEVNQMQGTLNKAIERSERKDEEIRSLMNDNIKTSKKIAEREIGFLKSQVKSKNAMLEMLLEDRKRKEVYIAFLEQQRGLRRLQVVSLDRFCAVLAKASPAGAELAQLDRMFQHPNEDLERALVQRGKIKAADQARAQSLLHHHRFAQWMGQRHSDMILVDGNIRSADRQKLSALSVFCASFVASMIKVQPEEVVVQFFCGLHCGPNDSWRGPNGMVRSLIMQLVMNLEQLELLSLDFINNRKFLGELEAHDLRSLCITLRELVSQFPPDRTVICVIDSISCFDVAEMIKDLEAVTHWLLRIVDDESLMTSFKVLMTNPGSRNLRIKKLLQGRPPACVSLSSNNLLSTPISHRVMETHLLRPSTPIPPEPKRQVLFDDVEDFGHEDYEGYHTD